MGAIEAERSRVTDTGEQYRSRFIQISEMISEMGRSLGVTIVPFSSPELPYFSSLTKEKKLEVLGSLETYFEICVAAQSENIDLLDSKRLVWFALSKMGLRPKSDLFSTLDADGIIEVYNGSTQIFRNFTYFKFCSYTLEDLTSRDWVSLFSRDLAVQQQLMCCVNDCIENQKTVTPKVPKHIVAETESSLLFTMEYKLKLLSPLSSEAEGSFFLTCVQAQLLPEVPKQVPQPELGL